MRNLKKLALELEKNPESFNRKKLLEQISAAKENARAYSFTVALNFVMESTFGKKSFSLDYSKNELLEGLFQLGYFYSVRNRDSLAHLIASMGTDIADGEHSSSETALRLMFLRMMTAFEMGLEDETKEYYGKLIKMDKDVPKDISFDYYNALGLVSVQLYNNETSYKYYRKALKFAEDSRRKAMIQINIADLHYANGEYDKSIELLEKINVPDYPSFVGYAETSKLKIFLIKNDLLAASKAVKRLEKLNDSRPNWIDYWYSYVFLGHYYLKLGNKVQALNYLEEIKSYPDYDNNKYIQGEALVLEAATKSASGKKIEGLKKSIEAHNLLKNNRTSSLHLRDLVINLQNSAIKIFEDLIDELSKSDDYTAGHTMRVSQLSFMIGKNLKLNRPQLFNLAIGAMLHDYGKMIVPSEVLNKPAKLNDDEMESVRKHPTFGASYLQHLDFPAEIVNIVKYHHERFDGSGYPEGLTKKQIPLLVQIVAAADVFDALTTDRPYRKALSFEEAREYMRKKGNNIASKKIINELLDLTKEDLFKKKDVDFKSICVPIIEEILQK
ncbi:MAG: HD domain-containing protein [Thermotogota bacterium]|nr:HD domain-containing protein [Thermotogota bacterium]